MQAATGSGVVDKATEATSPNTAPRKARPVCIVLSLKVGQSRVSDYHQRQSIGRLRKDGIYIDDGGVSRAPRKLTVNCGSGMSYFANGEASRDGAFTGLVTLTLRAECRVSRTSASPNQQWQQWVDGGCWLCEAERQQCIAYRPLEAQRRQCEDVRSIVAVMWRSTVGHELTPATGSLLASLPLGPATATKREPKQPNGLRAGRCHSAADGTALPMQKAVPDVAIVALRKNMHVPGGVGKRRRR